MHRKIQQCTRVGTRLAVFLSLFLLSACGTVQTYYTRVDSRQPTLTWPVFPRDEDLLRDPNNKLEKATDISYEVVIWEEIGRRLSYSPIYRQRFLKQPSYTPPEKLKPGRVYRWTYRAWFKIDNRLRMTDWGYLSDSRAPTYLYIRTPYD